MTSSRSAAAPPASALTLARARRSVVVIDAGEQRNLPATGVHGFLTRDGLAPAEPVALGRAGVERYGATVVDGRVAALAGSAGEFTATLQDGLSFGARRLLVATGGLVDELLRGVRLASDDVVPRRRLAVAAKLVARAEILAGIGLEATEHKLGVGRRIEADASGVAA